MGFPLNHPAILQAREKGLIDLGPAKGSVKVARRSKYGSHAVVVDGVRFDSRKEARRWLRLTAMRDAGEIGDLRRQVRYELIVNGVLICAYYADFVYRSGGAEVVEDVKSAATRKNERYRLKRKLMRAVHGIDILET